MWFYVVIGGVKLVRLSLLPSRPAVPPIGECLGLLGPARRNRRARLSNLRLEQRLRVARLARDGCSVKSHQATLLGLLGCWLSDELRRLISWLGLLGCLLDGLLAYFNSMAPVPGAVCGFLVALELCGNGVPPARLDGRDGITRSRGTVHTQWSPCWTKPSALRGGLLIL